jgi:hypothetical protein
LSGEVNEGKPLPPKTALYSNPLDEGLADIARHVIIVRCQIGRRRRRRIEEREDMREETDRGERMDARETRVRREERGGGSTLEGLLTLPGGAERFGVKRIEEVDMEW